MQSRNDGCGIERISRLHVLGVVHIDFVLVSLLTTISSSVFAVGRYICG